ncbi:tetratricopeptide repeat protein [Saprospira grandis]|uniref:tetratricopeptide repeat protein n=1 Tax=Saprospira grandis TaxID=1008 RepID=UPI0022DDA54E|nr:tetratricopeptide repeat protein [Saprospira grandis]WBM73070.1 tetratricopeptide repeat protein [Saprospira grandis]
MSIWSRLSQDERLYAQALLQDQTAPWPNSQSPYFMAFLALYKLSHEEEEQIEELIHSSAEAQLYWQALAFFEQELNENEQLLPLFERFMQNQELFTPFFQELPNFRKQLVQKAQELFLLLKQPDLAEELLQLLGAQLYENETAVLLQAKRYAQIESEEQALECYEEGLKHFPKSLLLWRNLAQLQYQLEDFQGAIDSLNQCVEESPYEAEYYVALAQNYAQSGEKERAKQFIDIALSMQAQNEAAHFLMAQMALEQEQVQEAMQFLSPENWESPLLLAEKARIVWQYLGDPQLAKDYFQGAWDNGLNAEQHILYFAQLLADELQTLPQAIELLQEGQNRLLYAPKLRLQEYIYRLDWEESPSERLFQLEEEIERLNPPSDHEHLDDMDEHFLDYYNHPEDFEEAEEDDDDDFSAGGAASDF